MGGGKETGAVEEKKSPETGSASASQQVLPAGPPKRVIKGEFEIRKTGREGENGARLKNERLWLRL